MRDNESNRLASDQVLLARTRAGRRDAFGELWLRHSPAAIRMARRFTRLDPDDLVAEAFTRIYRAVLCGGGPSGPFRPYLYTVTRNIAATWGGVAQPVLVDDLETIEDPVSHDDPMERALDRSLLADAFGRLPERWQAVLWYTEVEGLSPGEVAPILQLSPNGVAALAYRAREGLRKQWLQAHISASGVGGDCGWTLGRLGDRTREALSGRESARLEAHLTFCDGCAAAAAEVDAVGSRLALTIAKFVLAGAAGSELLTALSRPEAALANSAGAEATGSAFWNGAVATVSPVATPGAAVHAIAAGAAVLIGGGALLGVVGGGAAVKDGRAPAPVAVEVALGPSSAELPLPTLPDAPVPAAGPSAAAQAGALLAATAAPTPADVTALLPSPLIQAVPSPQDGLVPPVSDGVAAGADRLAASADSITAELLGGVEDAVAGLPDPVAVPEAPSVPGDAATLLGEELLQPLDPLE